MLLKLALEPFDGLVGRESRAKNMNKFIDHLIAIFPFEKVYFDKYNLPCSYFGNPLVELDFSLLPPYCYY